MESTSWLEVEKTEILQGIYRQTISGSASTITRYTYEPGSVFPPHSHPEEQITVVHQGIIEFDVEDETMTLRAGDLAIIPAGAVHGARVVGNEVVVSDNYLPTGSRTPLQTTNHDG